MESVGTLTEALDSVSSQEGCGFSHMTDERHPSILVTFHQLAKRARRVAAALQEAGIRPGDRVGLILPESSQFVEAIFGCMYAGVIAVPIYPPMNLSQIDVYIGNTTHIVRRAGCRMVLTDARVRPLLGTLMGHVPGLRLIEEFAGLLRRVDAHAEYADASVSPDAVAFLQFTSGSTSRPKGVTLTHKSLMTNIRCIGASLELRYPEKSAAVTWLPLFHDMGLIGCVFVPIVYAANVLFMPPLLFLKRPALWLRKLAETESRFTFAPNFAYGLCANRIKDSEIGGLDLSSLVVAGCGAEPIQRGTLEAFATRFAPYGFRSSAFVPCYGLAEHTLAATFARRGHSMRSERLDPVALAEGKACVSTTEHCIEVVCCGHALPGHEVRIEDDRGQVLTDGRVGHIRLRGQSVMSGYWDDSEGTASALRDGWLTTGDLGYLRDGELYVCGRLKDLIIIQGRNYHPSDIEWQAGQVEGVRRGNIVAFGVYDATLGRERIVVAAEVRDIETAESLRNLVMARVLEALSLRLDEIIFLAPHTLPKTSSGKLQRSRTMELYCSGKLGHARGGKLELLTHLAASQWGLLKAKLSSAVSDGD